MQLDLRVPADYMETKSHLPPDEEYVVPVKASWHSTEQRRFVCDEARIPHVWMKRVGYADPDTGKTVTALEVGGVLTTEWFRQSADVGLSLLVDGEEKHRTDLKDLTIGDDDTAGLAYAGGSSRQLSASWPTTVEEMKSWFGPESDAVLRIVLTIPE